MKDELQKLKEEVLKKLSEIKDAQSLRELEIKYFGRKGELSGLLKRLAELGGEEKKIIGRQANEIKLELSAKLSEAKEKISGKMKKSQSIDITLPGEKIKRGHPHPITIVQNELEDLFVTMGFMVLNGPEVESDYYNFEALNIPRYHPARDMQDTFYLDKKNKAGELDLVMRTHTSPMQVRAMQKYGAPLKCIIPGRCFRSEATDVRHDHTFYQLEGLLVDKGISFADMKGILEITVQELFGPETKLRLRPKFYPFVEPGANGEVTCFLCQGAGCRLCKNSGWLEILGCGLVHPNVLSAGGIDPAVYQGFAFGLGLTRLAMLKYDINDVRLFMGGDLRFLEQF